MPSGLRIAVLGPVRARSGGRPLPLGPARQRAVLAALASAANRIVTPGELVTAVWGASPPAAARDNLYTYVSGLRRILTADVIESWPAGYLLRLDEGTLDCDRFATMTVEAASRGAAGDGAGAAALFGRALRLWHGEAYSGLDGELFEVERARLSRLRLDTIERRARLLLEQGDDGLVAELSDLIREHGLHEPLYELLMRALHRAGRRAEALDVFRTARGVLVAELGVEPGAPLRELHRQILDDTPEPWADLSEATKEVLRDAALLGPQFRAETLIAVTRRAPLEVLAALQEALAATVLHEVADGLAFRDPAPADPVRRGRPEPARAERRRRLAGVLADLGRPAVEVAAQLTAETLRPDDWTVSWAVAHLAEVAEGAPHLANRLSRLLLDSPLPSAEQRGMLLVTYARSDLRLGGRPLLAARQALDLVADPAHRAEMRQILATLWARDGDLAQATALLRSALADRRTPPVWLTRHRMLLAGAGRAGDPYDTVGALQRRWRTHSIRRDHAAALGVADRALGLLGERTPHAHLHLDLLDNRVFSLQNLDRLDEADRSLHEATRVGVRHRLVAPLAITAAVQRFWTGRWSDAVAQLSAVTDESAGVGLFGRREHRAGVLLSHGVAALIAAHRDDGVRAAAHLAEAATHLDAGVLTDAERENSDFLLVARAVLAERRDRPGDSVEVLAPLLDPGHAPMLLRHQWLPYLIRVARQAGRADVAERAAALGATEAADERTPARAGAALAHCRALLSGDPGPALAAAGHYRSVGRVPERAAALEDAAVLLAARGNVADAAGPEGEAMTLYRSLGAHWDARRLRTRIAAAGPSRA
ncbi:BTAD domain-containing putative transcriptional regulator [Micromonosporaceae bacterium Da 78-11]